MLSLLLKLLSARPLLVAGLAGSFLVGVSGFAYVRGRVDCNARHEAAEARAAQEWAKAAAKTSKQAEKAGVDAARLDAKNEEKASAVKKQAAREPAASDECLSAAVVDGLRDIR